MTRLHLNRGQIQSLAIISLLISVTVALPLTTAPVRALSVQTRGLTLMLTAISVAFLIFSARGNRIALFSTITFALFYLYGKLMAAIMGGIS
ncbi:MAG: hypothetical protein OQK00_07825, partial [Rhodobacteraceae bacterium]|nr:hypothetical protein [Paracoccaceae bacterium]